MKKIFTRGSALFLAVLTLAAVLPVYVFSDGDACGSHSSESMVPVIEAVDGSSDWFGKTEGTCNLCGETVEAAEDMYGIVKHFTDVKENHWFMSEVAFCVRQGLVSGMTETIFAPNSNLTRAQFLTLLAKYDGVDLSVYDTADAGFEDVKSAHWFNEVVCWAVENGYTSGISETRFGPNNNITRAQLARFFYVYTEKNNYDVSEAADILAFPDAGKVQAWAEVPVKWAVAKGLIAGINGNLSPNGNATRAQAARIFMMYSATEQKKNELSVRFKEALDAGIAWEELADRPKHQIKGTELIKLFENAIDHLGKPDANGFILEQTEEYNGKKEVLRYELADFLYGVHKDVILDHDFTLSATAIRYEVGGAYNDCFIWGCKDIGEIDSVCNYRTEGCDFAIRAFDRITGEKLIELYDDITFRPVEVVTVEAAVESVFRFSRSFEKDPVYTDVSDDRAAKHTIDEELYTGETTLPDATNEDLPNWRGCNISYNSMFAGAICYNPDDVFAEANLDYLKDLGVNFVHIYLSWSYFQGPDHTFDNKVNLTRLEQLDEIISWCMERDIHIQLVFNDVPNLDWNNLGENPDWMGQWNSIFYDEAIRDNVTLFWRMLSKRYADIPNNYLSFNLMNECDPTDDENYLWAFEDAVSAIREATPDRVIVADVHTYTSAVTGESMAKLGCALSYHYYNLKDISVVTQEKEASDPGFYESIKGTPAFVNAHLYGPTYWNEALPDVAKGSLKFSGAVGGAILSVRIGDISWFETEMRISAEGKTLYQGMVPSNYIAEQDYFEIIGDGIVTVNIPEDATYFEISCPEGSCFTMSELSLSLKDGTDCLLYLLNDNWSGTELAKITVNEDGSCTGTIGLENIEQHGTSLCDLIAIGKKYGVDVMVGEFGFFESGVPMAAGISQEATEKMFADQINTFEKYDLAWCCEYIGRYALVTPAPYLSGIEYMDLEDSPYYVNLSMDAFFRKILSAK